jgi:hypothetical protein
MFVESGGCAAQRHGLLKVKARSKSITARIQMRRIDGVWSQPEADDFRLTSRTLF